MASLEEFGGVGWTVGIITDFHLTELICNWGGRGPRQMIWKYQPCAGQ